MARLKLSTVDFKNEPGTSVADNHQLIEEVTKEVIKKMRRVNLKNEPGTSAGDNQQIIQQITAEIMKKMDKKWTKEQEVNF